MFEIPFFEFGGEGPILHFAHPNGFTPATFRQFAQPLTRHYRVFGMCQRPLWNNSRPQALDSWHLLADDLIRFFDQQGWRDVIGAGLSSGAVATMLASLKRPSLFRALVLIEPVFLSPSIIDLVNSEPNVIESLPLVKRTRRRRYQWPSRQAAFDHFRAKPNFSRWSDSALWDYVNHALHENLDGGVALTYLREWEAHIYVKFPRDVWQFIPQVTHPTLAIRAEESDTVYPEAWQLWQKMQPQAQFVQIAESGHMVPMERPSQVAEIMLDFLRGL